MLNLMFNVNDRDLIQVAERIAGDARIRSPHIKEACQRLISVTAEQVLEHKVTQTSTGRELAQIKYSTTSRRGGR